ncbi:MAG: hypothetical protein R2881_09635 [Eubacteriales bacterium]
MPNLPEAYPKPHAISAGRARVCAAYLAAMERQPRRALRVNLLKTTVEKFSSQADFHRADGHFAGELLFEDDVAISTPSTACRGAMLCAGACSAGTTPR